MFDRLLIRFYPVFNIAAIIGMICGLALFGMAVARQFDLIDMGASFENIEPIWMMGGGLGLVLTFWFKRAKIKTAVEESKARIE